MHLDLTRLDDRQLAQLADYCDHLTGQDTDLLGWLLRQLTEGLRLELAERRRPHM